MEQLSLLALAECELPHTRDLQIAEKAWARVQYQLLLVVHIFQLPSVTTNLGELDRSLLIEHVQLVLSRPEKVVFIFQWSRSPCVVRKVIHSSQCDQYSLSLRQNEIRLDEILCIS